MADQQFLTTRDCINAVYAHLGGPTAAVLSALPGPIVCAKAWLQLAERQLELNIADRTHYLNRFGFTAVANSYDIDLSGVANFGGALYLERILPGASPETTQQVPVLGNMQNKDEATERSAFIHRDSETGNLMLRWTEPPTEDWSMRLWYEPSVFGRPGLAEFPMLPLEAANVWIYSTTFACLPDVAKVYDAQTFGSFRETTSALLQEAMKNFRIWREKNRGAGRNKRTPYNRRRGNRGGLGPFSPDYGLE